MSVDKQTTVKLKKYAQVFREARERNANESDTVMYLIRFFEDVLNYDSLAGEISKEISIKDKYCDFGVKLSGEFKFIVEVKAAGNKSLREKDIEQAANYGSRSGIKWVLLTNGIEWQLYHLSFSEGEGITQDLVFLVDFVENAELNPDKIWDSIGLLEKESVRKGSMEDFLSHKKALSPQSLIKTLFTEDVLMVIRRELNRIGEVRLDILDVVEAIKEVLSKDALMAAGDIGYKKRRRRKKRIKTDGTVENIEFESGSAEDLDSEEEITDGKSSSQEKPAR
jgi:hypothetical protein